MDPRPLSPEQWGQIADVLLLLFLFAALALNAALALLLGHAILPSLLASGELPPQVRLFRWASYPIAALSLVLTLYCLGRALVLAVALLQAYYPRFAL